MKRMSVHSSMDKNAAREPERHGDIRLAYFLRDGPLASLAVVGYPGAEGFPLVIICGRRVVRCPSCGYATEWNLNRKQSGWMSAFAAPVRPEQNGLPHVSFSPVSMDRPLPVPDKQNKKTTRRTMP